LVHWALWSIGLDCRPKGEEPFGKNHVYFNTMKVKVSRKEHFNAAHRLYNSEWSTEKNEKVFGKCSNPNYHGHNYEVIVSVIGEPDPSTGYVFDMKMLSDLIRENVLVKLDHKNLNLDTEFFKNLNPTAENIAVVIWRILRQKIDSNFELKITLYETERNFVEYPAS
jgi:6-pyruvoyltetrahydropterin/6-carboxytetrahydropterin synthase